MTAAKNAFYAQSGGVTSVINTSACGVIETARQYPKKIALGLRHQRVRPRRAHRGLSRKIDETGMWQWLRQSREKLDHYSY